MLNKEQYESVVTYEAFQNMQAALQIAGLTSQAQQLQQQLGEAVKKIEQQQATIALKDDVITSKDAVNAKLAQQLADVAAYNDMTIEGMLEEVARGRTALTKGDALADLAGVRRPDHPSVPHGASDTEGGAKD